MCAQRVGRIDKDDGIALAVEPNLEEKRRIDDEGARRDGSLCELQTPCGLDPRMHDALDVAADGLVGEDRAAKRGTVDRSIGT